MIDFSYLKNWLDEPNPRPIVLECVPSRSGMSMSVYDREKLLYRINGCGFDRLGCALAEFLERLYQDDLRHLKSLTTDSVFSIRFPASKFTALTYGCKGTPMRLEGCAGLESMREIAEAIGLHVQLHETRNATLLIIQKAR